jgi:hypothetical protein
MATDKKITELTGYTPALDADLLPIVDTATETTKKITWANIKATLKTYFDTLYPSGSGTSTGTNTGDNATNSQYSGIVKATGAELDTATNDDKFATAKAIKDSKNVPSVAPGTSGNILTSNGTDWTSVTPTSSSMTYKNGTATRAMNTASGVQNIAHGLGAVPKKVRITGRFTDGLSGRNSWSDGVYNGTTNSCVWINYANSTAGVDDTYGVKLLDSNSGTTQVAVITCDATNIILTWTLTGSGTASLMNLMWEAE